VVQNFAQAYIEIDDKMDREKFEKAQNDRRTLVAAPALPLTLIEPLAPSPDFAQVGSTAWGVTAVGAESSPFTGAGVTVAVLDSGIDANHPAFKGVKLEPKNFTGVGSDDDVSDTRGHGTHCAGTLFGRDVDGLRIGVARGVKKALIGKVLGFGGGSSAKLCQAIMWAVEEDANVISMSLGIDFPGWVKELVEKDGLRVPHATSLALEQYRANIRLFDGLSGIVSSRADVGTQTALIIAASGNASGRDATPPYAINVEPPAASVGVVAVGALGQAKGGLRIAPFSNTRPDVAAPGVNIMSADFGVKTCCPKSGTSMATPHVAGVAALWAEKLAKDGQLNPLALQSKLIGSGVMKDLAPHTSPVDVGQGLVQAPAE
jgi:subtilisin family serine protease